MRILVVDDQATMRRVIVHMLKKLGHDQCFEAKDGRDAVNLLKTIAVDLVITDWRMPNMDGIALLHTLREGELTKELPVLFVTTNAEQTHVLTALQAGASSYLVKPFTPTSFREKVELMTRINLQPDPKPGN